MLWVYFTVSPQWTPFLLTRPIKILGSPQFKEMHFPFLCTFSSSTFFFLIFIGLISVSSLSLCVLCWKERPEVLAWGFLNIFAKQCVYSASSPIFSPSLAWNIYFSETLCRVGSSILACFPVGVGLEQGCSWGWGSTVLITESQCDAQTFSPPTRRPNQLKVLFSPKGSAVEIWSQLRRASKAVGIDTLEAGRLAKTQVLRLFSKRLSISQIHSFENPRILIPFRSTCLPSHCLFKGYFPP